MSSGVESKGENSVVKSFPYAYVMLMERRIYFIAFILTTLYYASVMLLIFLCYYSSISLKYRYREARI